jgi:hypothetical protein
MAKPKKKGIVGGMIKIAEAASPIKKGGKGSKYPKGFIGRVTGRK